MDLVSIPIVGLYRELTKEVVEKFNNENNCNFQIYDNVWYESGNIAIYHNQEPLTKPRLCYSIQTLQELVRFYPYTNIYSIEKEMSEVIENIRTS